MVAKTLSKHKKLANAPKRPPTPYLAFTSKHRKSHPELLQGKNVSEQREYLVKTWRDLDPSVKVVFEKEYKELKNKYKADYEIYVNSPQYVIDCQEAGIKIKRKRPKSAYNLFVSTEYKKMTGTFSECAQKLSAKWKTMSDTEKEKYIKMSEEERKQFKESEQSATEE